MRLTKFFEILKKETLIEGIHLRYVLCHTEDPEAPEGFDNIYSLEITEFDGDLCESEFLEDISRNFIEAKRIMELFASETVMPCTARCIMEDLLS